MRRLTLFALAALAAIFLAVAATAPAVAQSSGDGAAAVTIDKRKLLVQPRNEDGTLQRVSILEDPVLWARDLQQDFYGRLSGALRSMRLDPTFSAVWTLLLLSFAYGIFHAAGPGHGKAVISAWLLATESEFHRGLLVSLLSAVIQALTAIVLVSVLFLVVASAGAVARDVAGVLESTSYGLIGLTGLYLVWTALRPSIRAHRHAQLHTVATPGATPGLHHFDAFQPVAGDHRHAADCACGHAHLPEARELRGDWSLARAFSLAFAVGIRPCTGAILVLVFANALGLYWAGIASTFAMALGTFITVSVIAAIAVHSRKLATRLAGQNDRWLHWLGTGLRLGGGVAIAFLGEVLFLGSLGQVNSFM